MLAQAADADKSAAQKVVQDKVVGAVQTRAAVASAGARDLVAFIKGSAELEERAGKARTPPPRALRAADSPPHPPAERRRCERVGGPGMEEVVAMALIPFKWLQWL